MTDYLPPTEHFSVQLVQPRPDLSGKVERLNLGYIYTGTPSGDQFLLIAAGCGNLGNEQSAHLFGG